MLRAWPEPPSRTASGRECDCTWEACMVFSFDKEREHPCPVGNLGFPIRDWPPESMARIGAGTRRAQHDGPSSREQGCCSELQSQKGYAVMITFSRMVESGAGQNGRPRQWPGKLERQVSTATPAELDSRVTGVTVEGCADTMSTEAIAVWCAGV